MAAILENMLMIRLHMNYRSARNLVLDGRVRLHMEKNEPFSEELKIECERMFKEKFDSSVGHKEAKQNCNSIQEDQKSGTTPAVIDEQKQSSNRKEVEQFEEAPSFETAETSEETILDQEQQYHDYIETDETIETGVDLMIMPPHKEDSKQAELGLVTEKDSTVATVEADPWYVVQTGKVNKVELAVHADLTEGMTETEIPMASWEDDYSNEFVVHRDEQQGLHESAVLAKQKNGFLHRSFRRFSRIGKKKQVRKL